MIKNTTPDAVMAQGVEFTSGGRAYRVRPLGILDVLALARIAFNGINGLARTGTPLDLDFTKPDFMGPALAQAFAIGVMADSDAAMETFGQIVQEKGDDKAWANVGDDILDPEKFSGAAMFDIWGALQTHPDLIAFFGRAAEMLSTPATPTPS